MLLVLLFPLTLKSEIIPVNIENFELSNYVWNNLLKFLNNASLTIPATPVIVYQTNNLEEFYQLTNKPYHVGGVYKDFIIILQPINILKKKGVYDRVLLHELLHWILYGLNEKYQEGLIYWWMGEYDKKEVDYFLSDFNGDLPSFILNHWH
ncbi:MULTISPECIES: hypothetical protein [unclassified Thermosipho (in: thermotogales)]|uniref:hypothetical protein n=1 Tax=unclassified Thermosipho (in: thermotogales) TaxID=2676525 RepID=UPI001E2E63F0|nr:MULTISPECIES: hypothetical protein [unclassified Thermosipho (in: thermotogales)]